MSNISAAALTDTALLAATIRAADAERQSTTHLLALLAEVDSRKLYLAQGYPSLFAWCMQVLHLSEPSAYSRITAARASRRFPLILSRLAEGSVTLTTVSLLAAHLTDENHEELIKAAHHKSKREVERIVASLDPQPDVASSVRRLAVVLENQPLAPTPAVTVARPQALPAASGRPVVAPLSPDRYLLKITLSQDTHAKLARIQDLLRHSVPTGDPAAIVDRALTVLLEQLEKTKCAASARPSVRPGARPSARIDSTTNSRHVPASVKRDVWARDEGRCAFVGVAGRCRATGFLEFHHVVPFARGGPTTVENLQLRCRAHNAYEVGQAFGSRADVRSSRRSPALSGQSRQSTHDLLEI